MKYTTPYIPPTLTVDAVIFQLVNNELNVLLLKRLNDPFKDTWALPGGYNAEGETTKAALSRIANSKTGVDIDKDLTYVEQLFTFDTIDRDPRGHAVSVTYMGFARDISESISKENAALFPVNSLPDLAYDHANIIKYAHQRLASKLTYTNAMFAFLPPTFTLTELQLAYEAIIGRELDKRNFRKKILSLEFLEETNQMRRDGAYRPAKLYRFKSQSLVALSRSFD